MAVEVVAQWMYDESDAAVALLRAHTDDPHPAVRKKAGWFVPGGARYERMKPRVTR